MFAIEEELDKKLWLYAIHMGKDRSEVVNDLLRPIVASMVLYDSRDRRGQRKRELAPERNGRSRWRLTDLQKQGRGSYCRFDVGEEQRLAGSEPSSA